MLIQRKEIFWFAANAHIFTEIGITNYIRVMSLVTTTGLESHPALKPGTYVVESNIFCRLK